MNRRGIAQRVRGAVRHTAWAAFVALAVGGADAAVAAVRGQAPADSASFVPDDNRAFQLDVPGDDDEDDDVSPAPPLEVICAFYDQGAGGEKRVIVYRDAPSPMLLGLAVRSRWAIAAECVAPGVAAIRGTSRHAAAVPPVVVRLPAVRGRRRRTVLVVAWTRRRDGHWAQLERYSVLRQRGGVMYQFGDFRVPCCLEGASAYVRRARIGTVAPAASVAADDGRRIRPPPPPSPPSSVARRP